MVRDRLNILLALVLLFVGSFSIAENEEYRPAQAFRFTRSLNKIESILKNAKDKEELLSNLAKDGRGWAFSLEGLARIYEDTYEGELDSIQRYSKKLEDSIGKYSDTLGHIKFAQELEWKTPNGKPPTDVQKHLTEEMNDARDALWNVLTKDRWLEVNSRGVISKKDFPRIRLIQDQVDSIDWRSPKKDRIDVLEAFEKHVKKKLKNAEYDYSELQSGVHELRRQLRWPMIWLQEVHGMFVGTGKKIEGLEGIKRDKNVTQSPYAKLPPVTAQYPILIPKTAYFWLRKLVSDLGDVKDVGEASEEWLLEALKQSKYTEPGIRSKKELAQRLVETHPKFVDKDEVLPKVQEVMDESELFPSLVKTLKKQQDWSKSKCIKKFEELGS